ncbi:MAG: AMMECR1 domain-containing protein [Clostridium sp.]
MNLSYLEESATPYKELDLFSETIIDTFKKNSTLDILSLNKLLTPNSCYNFKPLEVLLGIIDTFDTTTSIYSCESFDSNLYLILKFNAGTSFGLSNYFLEKARSNHLNNLLYKNPYTTLCRKALVYFFDNGHIPNSSFEKNCYIRNLSHLGAFIEIYLDDSLRCYAGSTLAQTEDLQTELIKITFDAAFNNTQFKNLTFNELLACKITIHLVTNIEPASFLSLDYYKYGVTIHGNGKVASVLPRPTGIRNTFEQVNLVQKLAELDDIEDFTFERFTTITFEE